MQFLFPYHPRLVHFPIALLLAGVVFAGWGLLRKQDRWTTYGRTSLVLGWLALLAAIGSGLIDQSFAPDTQVVRDTINLHITAGIGLLVVFGLALYWPLRDRKLWSDGGKRAGYVALLALGALLVLTEAWLGGQLVYHLGVGVARP